MSDWHYIILLYILGLSLLYIEIYLPGAVLGIFGGLCVLASMIVAFQKYSGQWAMLISLLELAGLAVFLLLGIKYLPKTKTGRKLILGRSLESSDGYSSADPNFQSLLGQTGVTATPLRPAGTVKIGKSRYDVVTQGDFIDADVAVIVIQVEGNRVVVKKV